MGGAQISMDLQYVRRARRVALERGDQPKASKLARLIERLEYEQIACPPSKPQGQGAHP